MMRAGLHRPVHVKMVRSQKLRMPLTHASCCDRRRSPSERPCAVLCITLLRGCPVTPRTSAAPPPTFR
jgi:hypothetical protein